MRITVGMLEARFSETIELLIALDALEPDDFALQYGSATNGVAFGVLRTSRLPRSYIDAATGETVTTYPTIKETNLFPPLGRTKASAYAVFDTMAHTLRMVKNAPLD